MNILALDSSVEVLSAALTAKTGAWYIEAVAGTRHSELLMECIETLCKLAEIQPKDLNFVACMQGPGSFTGLRIGFSAAKGLSMALGIPLTSIPTLDCMAYHLSMWPGIVIPSIDAKKSCVYAALYRNGSPISGYMDIPPETLAKMVLEKRLSANEPIVLTGPGAVFLLPFLSDFIPPVQLDPAYKRGRARELLEIAKSSIVKGENNVDSGPLYLRKSDAELNLG